MRRAVEDGEGSTEERAQSSQASADSFCKVMGILGMGHRLFVPKLLAVREGGLGEGYCLRETEHAGMVWFSVIENGLKMYLLIMNSPTDLYQFVLLSHLL